jgi:hypothetical protein
MYRIQVNESELIVCENQKLPGNFSSHMCVCAHIIEKRNEKRIRVLQF